MNVWRTRELAEVMRPFTAGSDYVNQIGLETDEGSERIKAAYGCARYRMLITAWSEVQCKPAGSASSQWKRTRLVLRLDRCDDLANDRRAIGRASRSDRRNAGERLSTLRAASPKVRRRDTNTAPIFSTKSATVNGFRRI